MKVTKIKYCFKCDEDIEPNIDYTEDRVNQSCPLCRSHLGSAGAFMISEGFGETKIKVELID